MCCHPYETFSFDISSSRLFHFGSLYIFVATPVCFYAQGCCHKPIDISDKVLAIAKKKGLDIYSKINQAEDSVILSADTIVVLDNIILGKPKDKEDARNMISLLNGKTHQVYTAVYIKGKNIEYQFLEKTDVDIVPMNIEEIEEYINTKEPYDKAGSYAIQGIFSKYISAINGDYYNVMGLPICKVNSILKKLL